MFNKSNSTNSSHALIKTSKTNLYIKGLPEHFNDLRLQQLVPFENKVKSVKAAMDDDLKCKGYGFIDFINEEAADEAKKYIETNYSTYPVKFAKENEKDRTNLYVTNIPKEWTNTDSDKLKKIFEIYGEVQSAFIMQEKSSNKTTGIGFVRFSSEQDAEMAIEWFEKNKIVLEDCNAPLEAKYADKHNPENRKRRNIDGNVKSYTNNLMTHSSPIFTDTDVQSLSNRMFFNGYKLQDLLSMYPMLISTGNNNIQTFPNVLPYNMISYYNPMSNNGGFLNLNAVSYLNNDLMSSQMSHFPNSHMSSNTSGYIIPSTDFSPFGSSTQNIDYWM